jgi:hypothetical protein
MSAVLSFEEETRRLRRRVEAAEEQAANIKARMNQPSAMRDEIGAIRARYDALDVMFGRSGYSDIMGPVPGELPLEYRRRRLKDFVKYSPSCQHVRADALGEDSIGAIEAVVVKDAACASYDPASYPPNTINPVKYRDESGRECTRWVGSGCFTDLFSLQGAVGRIRDPGDEARFRYGRGSSK